MKLNKQSENADLHQAAPTHMTVVYNCGTEYIE